MFKVSQHIQLLAGWIAIAQELGMEIQSHDQNLYSRMPANWACTWGKLKYRAWLLLSLHVVGQPTALEHSLGTAHTIHFVLLCLPIKMRHFKINDQVQLQSTEISVSVNAIEVKSNSLESVWKWVPEGVLTLLLSPILSIQNNSNKNSFAEIS